jgi:threonine dehydrogenase-like Zn-dependent dehydrogenase
MRAAVLAEGRVRVQEVPDPVPGPGQVLARVRACGVCGSDLHFVRHARRVLELSEQMGAPLGVDLARPVQMGHEFVAELVEPGPGTALPAPEGSLVTSVPLLVGPSGTEPIVYSNRVAGGYGELMLLSADLLLPVPDGLPAHLAALTEPMAVGLHAVNVAGMRPGQGALVLGCGPVGLAVIAALRAAGVESIVATDFSPARRELAASVGAHLVTDPRAEDGWAAWARTGGGRGLVVFEAVGVPGMLDGVLRAAPPGSRVVVVGVCMEPDTINPLFGIVKQLDLRFVYGYDPAEFAEALRRIATGETEVAPLVTGREPLERTPWAFDALGDPDRHCKIIIEP